MPTTEVKQPKPAGSRRTRWWKPDFIVRHWPFWTWLGLSALCLTLYVRSTQYGIITGTVLSIHHDVAPLQVARVKEIPVHEGSSVTRGQAVAQLDTTLVDTQLAEAEATLATAENAMAGYQGQMLSLVRTAEDLTAKTQEAIAQLRNQLEGDTAKLVQLRTIQAERDSLAKSKLITEQLAVELRPEIAYLEKQVASYPAQIAMNERTLEAHRKERADLQKTLRIGPSEDVLKAVSEKTALQTKVLETLVEMRKRERETYTLRSEADGVVSNIHVFPGAVAKPGESVLDIVSQTDLVIGYLPEFRLGLNKVGDLGYAFRLGRPSVKVKVVEIVPEVIPIPVQLSPIAAPLRASVRAQKIVFKTENPSDIMPGEKVEIRMQSDYLAKVKHWLVGMRD